MVNNIMRFIDLLIAILAPIIVPILDFALSEIVITNRIKGKNKNDCKKIETLSVFYKELPSAFIGNAIWGFTYHIQNYTALTIFWMCFYFFISFIAVLFLIFGYKKNINFKIYKICSILFSTVLIVITVIRISLS